MITWSIRRILSLTFLEQYCLSELTAELSTSCYAGALVTQAMGLGGWMYDGIDRHTVLLTGDPCPGLGFRYDRDDRWAYPYSGLPVFLKGIVLHIIMIWEKRLKPSLRESLAMGAVIWKHLVHGKTAAK